jgi:outer membrane protein assembly factor BamB
VSGDSAQVHALDIATGRPRWTFTTRAGTSRPVAVTDGVVAAAGGAAYGLAAADGRRLWEAEDTEVLAAGSGIVICWTRGPRSGSDMIVGLDATTGSRSWTHPLPESAQPSELRIAVDAGSAYLGTGTTLVALDVRSGAARWQYAAGSRINHLGRVGDVVFCVPDIGAATRDVVGLDAASGAPRWQTAYEWGVQGVGVDTENLYLHCVGSLQSWSAEGDSRWTTAQGLGGDPWPVFDPSTLAVTDHGCYVAGTYGLYDDTGRAMPIRDASSYGGSDAEFALFAFSPSSGRPRWRVPIEGNTELFAQARPLAAVPGTVFVSTPDAVHAVPEA